MFGQLKPGIVFLAALLLGGAVLADLRDTPAYLSPLVDAHTYEESARQIAAKGPGALQTPYYQPPLYPLLLGAIHWVSGGDRDAPRLINLALTAATAALVYNLAAGFAGPTAGFAAAVLFAGYGPVLYFVGELLPISLLLFLQTLAIWLALRAERSPRPLALLAGAGVALGLATGARPTSLLLAAALGIWWLRGPGDVSAAPNAVISPPVRKRAGLALAAACALVIAPWTIANIAGSGEPVLVSWNGGINFYLGNGANSDSLVAILPGAAWDRLQVEPLRAGVRSSIEESRYWTRRGFEGIRTEPLAWAGALGRKAIRLFSARETPRNTDWEAARPDSRVLSLPLAGFGLVAPLAAFALVRSRIPHRSRTLLLLAIGCAAFQNLAFFAADRYRLEAVPVLCVCAGLAFRDLRQGIPRGRRSAVAIALAAIVAVFAWVDWLGEWGVDRTREAIHRGVAERRLKRDVEARRDFEEAIRLSPNDPDAHRWLGEIALGEGRWENAVSHFDRALEAAPDYVRARLGKAQTLEKMGRAPEAEFEYRQALLADPWSAETRLNYGVWCAVGGRREDARRLFEEGLRLTPNDERFRRNLRRLDEGL